MATWCVASELANMTCEVLCTLYEEAFAVDG